MKPLVLPILILSIAFSSIQGQDKKNELLTIQERIRSAERNSYEYFEAIFELGYYPEEETENEETNNPPPEEAVDPFQHPAEDNDIDNTGVDFQFIFDFEQKTRGWERRPTRAEIMEMVKNKKITEIQPDFVFQNSLELRSTINSAREVFIYEGNMRGLYFSGKDMFKWATINNYKFMTPKQSVNTQQIAQLQNLIGSNMYFQNYRGAKLCGGFRPDYMIEWHVEKNPVQLMLCNGCHEIIISHKNQWFKHDYANAEKAKEIKAILAQFDIGRTKIKQLAAEKEAEAKKEKPGLTQEERKAISDALRGL